MVDDKWRVMAIAFRDVLAYPETGECDPFIQVIRDSLCLSENFCDFADGDPSEMCEPCKKVRTIDLLMQGVSVAEHKDAGEGGAA